MRPDGWLCAERRRQRCSTNSRDGLRRSATIPRRHVIPVQLSALLWDWGRSWSALLEMLVSTTPWQKMPFAPFVVGRKNWLFAGSPEGAKACAFFSSLLESAKANGLEPYAYLRFLCERIPFTVNREEYAALLPSD